MCRALPWQGARLVLLQVPAHDLLVQAAAEHVGVLVRDGEARDLLDVAGERELESARREVPHLDGAVARAGHKPFVARIERDAADPAEVTRDCAVHLPWRVPFGAWPAAGKPLGHCHAGDVLLLRAVRSRDHGA